ncbi:response regulator of citrate/malate metabolism [Saccharopolyspora erythraea NRRL 2338]|uniref:Transcriptional regulatory protein n=2 Tax=Saccharopolyspora erythraea TaxID=1836 RepID=A4FKM5_SACEN|nr:response regulator [Saccharopolyspora erythraea]EQD83094.1 chemotaxis protein CheY [Saccharopolyspora erythraea D]PFG98238.1 response regulator of citrate/malate metabolism [Saccharopolyspora erythraea NRRL 2338]QRK88334.1 response regulator [Saccharopolyspora erythraea]CAM04600.1 two-component system response regulator [Saccharopolyspora erythraea NRRL 2338]
MIKVLVVDDDFMVAKIHSGYVSRVTGFEVVGTAHTGADALRAVGELRPELVLLDIYLPDMDGLAVLRELRAGTARPSADPDVIVITAARDLDTVRGAIRGGALHYLIKPFSYEALRDQLENFRSLHRSLSAMPGDAPAAQQDVDRLFGSRARGSSAPPKGVSSETARIVEDILRERSAEGGDLSATECADATALSRVSARKYLEHFVMTGRAEVRLRYGGTGRPERRYRWL